MSPHSIPNRRWRIALLLGLGVLINFLDRINLSVSHNAIISEFGISDVGFGYLASAYAWTYGLSQIPVGMLLDRFGIKRICRAGTFLWSVASFAAAAAQGLSGLFAARFLLGIGEAPIFPANAKAVGLWFPQQERSMAAAIFDSAAKLASALGVPLIGIMLILVGWRWSFVFTGLISLLFFILFYRVYRDPGDDPRLVESERIFIMAGQPESRVSPGPAPKASLGDLLAEKKVLGLALGFGAYNYVFFLFVTWLPSYLASELHMDLLHSFLYTGVPWLLAALVDLVIGGWLVGDLIRRGWNPSTVRGAVLVGGMTLGLGLLGAIHSGSRMETLFWITISLSGLAAAAPVSWTVPSLIVPEDGVATVGGIMNFASQISGIAAPIVTGYVVARTHSYAIAFYVAGAYLVIGIAGYAFLLGRIEPARQRI